MGLQEYKQKRTFAKTPEPTGGKANDGGLHFVIQKHAASHLHYDFRLEMRGVLKSWAVPKGPSLDPEVKRLAMLVEDHPYDYKDFEGIIPEGNYGAGTVIIWDEGAYEPLEKGLTKKEQEKILLKGFFGGSLKIRMHGHKLKGEFALVRTQGRGENAWLLIKHKDRYARKTDITEKDTSVVSKKTIEQMAASKTAARWESNRNSDGSLKDRQRSKKKPTMAGSNWPELEAIPIENEADFDIDGCTIKINNIDRQVWKDVTKADLIQYYHSIAPYLLPYLKDRPLSLHIKPRGAMAPDLYIKDMEGRQPVCADIFQDKRRHKKAGTRPVIDYLVCNNEATLLYMINLGCIDVNPWMSRTATPQAPDFVNIDLDPSGNDFEKVIEVARAAKTVLSKWKLKTVVKTSGKTGLHIYIPVTGISYQQARRAAETIGQEVLALVPRIATTNVNRSQRGSKVFIDPSQNDYADTLAAAYTVRPNSIPTVSTPLSWAEVRKGLDPKQFTIFNTGERVKKKGDLFKNALNVAWAKYNTGMLRKRVFDVI
ncbi:hypothetical protein F0L74_09225 [Chitinophaga agrisoli]|uniref:Uncharacterized protein n=1 Tax=Chitinophaga agrisoli TaxID=2607653 RepID=A0A5B2VXG2_9BACT|nr:DNA polymerase ligase N-terminal domain-containing protein [Chitinophaga agrisoli]KAA2242699.1 hypothetical protein F0L74_09225 [Chitinophaga agrisoli]